MYISILLSLFAQPSLVALFYLPCHLCRQMSLLQDICLLFCRCGFQESRLPGFGGEAPSKHWREEALPADQAKVLLTDL